MAVCEHCGNEYDKSFQVIVSGKTHNFDSFECAIHVLAAIMCPLRRQDHGPRLGERGHVLLLRPLCRSERSAGFARSDLIGHMVRLRVFEGIFDPMATEA
jgi:hypothetical protein